MSFRDRSGRLLRRLGLLSTGRSVFRFMAGAFKDAGRYLVPGKDTDHHGFPLPPPSLCFRSAVSYDTAHFISSGIAGVESVSILLEKAGRPLETFHDILDFGCGCCRIARHLLPLREGVSFSGVEIDRRAVEWVRKNLSAVDMRHYAIGASIPLPDSRFDLVMAIAVFPLMSFSHQTFYLREIWRVLEPGGLLLITLKGAGRRHELSRDELAAFDDGHPVVIEPKSSGSIYCLSYHPESFVRDELSRGFDLLLHEREGSYDTKQDAWVFVKPKSANESAHDSME